MYTLVKIYLRKVSTSPPTNTTLVFADSVKEVNYRSELIENSVEQILMNGRDSTNSSPNKSGTQTGCLRTRHKSETDSYI